MSDFDEAALAFLEAVPLAVIDDMFGLAACVDVGHSAETAARAFHSNYERVSLQQGCRAGEKKVLWESLSENQRYLLIETFEQLIRRGFIA